jgi:hypothetical protein
VYSEGFDADSANHGGGADDEFATLILDERFVRAALIHEPSARERQAALSHSGYGSAYPRKSNRPRWRAGSPRGRHQALPGRWQRTVAQLLLVVLGVLAVLVAVAAVSRGDDTTTKPARVPATTAAPVHT